MSVVTVKAISAEGKVAIVEVGNGPKYIAGPATKVEDLATQVKEEFVYGSPMYDACMQSLLTKFDYKPPADC